MKFIACSILLLVILEESYCKTTYSENRTSNSWGYGYNLGDTRGFKVKYDDKGYHFDPFYNDTSSGLTKHYSSKSTYDQITSPGATNDSPSHSSTNDIINSLSDGTTNSRSYSPTKGGKVRNKVLLDNLPGGYTTAVPELKSHTVTVTNAQTEAPIAIDKTSYETPGGAPDVSSAHHYSSIHVGGINEAPNIPSNANTYKPIFGAPYGSQHTQMYGPPTGPLYYPQAPSYGQMYGPAGGSMYGLSNGQIYGPPSMGPMYGPPTGNPNEPTGAYNGQPTRSMSGFAPQNGQMYGPPNGQMYVPQNGQTNGCCITGSMYGSNRHY